MARLSLDVLGAVDPRARPVPAPEELSVGMLHLGIGAFHRAHQAVYTEKAMAATGATNWGICGVSERSAAAVDTLSAQDCLYSVTECYAGTAHIEVVGAVRQALFAQEQWRSVLERMAEPSTSVITLTVSEKGYRLAPSSAHLAHDDPDVLADVQGRPPRTVIGQLARGLQARRAANGAPVTVLCCDNLPDNGATLRQLIVDFCQLLGRSEGEPVLEWLDGNVTFPNTVVDRIVPAATDSDRQRAHALLGFEDAAAVVTEPFSQWVIEDCFAGPRPAWERAGALMVGATAPYEEMKLRLLNGSHSALAYLAGLAGFQLVAEAATTPAFSKYIRLFMDVDVTPTLTVPPGFDLGAYKESLMVRFANPDLRHRTAQIAMDGSQKLPYRLISTVRARLAAGEEPRYACLAIAGWMRYVSAGATDDGAKLALDDPLADRLRAAVSGITSPGDVARALLAIRAIFPPDISDNEVVRRLVTEDLGALARHGAAAVVAGLTG